MMGPARFAWLGFLLVAAMARGEDVLFIGNSFTFGATVPGLAEHGGVPKLVETIAQAEGLDLHAESITSPGKDWSWHLAQPATAQALNSKRWSWVVLQDYSLRPTRIGNIPKFMGDGLEFSDQIEKHSPHAGLVLYETWARPPGWFYLTPGGRHFSGPNAMMGDLHAAYTGLAARLGMPVARPVRVALVGTAFAKCRAEYPTINLDAADHHHATAEGYYLAALVIYEALASRGAQGAPTLFFNGVVAIPTEEAGHLQHVADEVMGGKN